MMMMMMMMNDVDNKMIKENTFCQKPIVTHY